MASTLIKSDYFPRLLLSKVSLVVAKSHNFLKRKFSEIAKIEYF